MSNNYDQLTSLTLTANVVGVIRTIIRDEIRFGETWGDNLGLAVKRQVDRLINECGVSREKAEALEAAIRGVLTEAWEVKP